jgi:hypothetical protein
MVLVMALIWRGGGSAASPAPILVSCPPLPPTAKQAYNPQVSIIVKQKCVQGVGQRTTPGSAALSPKSFRQLPYDAGGSGAQ